MQFISKKTTSLTMGLSMFQKRLQNSTMSIDLQEQKSKGVFSCSQIHFMEPDGIEDHAPAFLYRVNGNRSWNF
jgi:hypothetical protein